MTEQELVGEHPPSGEHDIVPARVRHRDRLRLATPGLELTEAPGIVTELEPPERVLEAVSRRERVVDRAEVHDRVVDRVEAEAVDGPQPVAERDALPGRLAHLVDVVVDDPVGRRARRDLLHPPQHRAQLERRARPLGREPLHGDARRVALGVLRDELVGAVGRPVVDHVHADAVVEQAVEQLLHDVALVERGHDREHLEALGRGAHATRIPTVEDHHRHTRGRRVAETGRTGEGGSEAGAARALVERGGLPVADRNHDRDLRTKVARARGRDDDAAVEVAEPVACRCRERLGDRLGAGPPELVSHAGDYTRVPIAPG